MNNSSSGKPLIIVLGAVVLLFFASLLPWGDITNGSLKDFSLLSDIFTGSIKNTAVEVLDPELEAALAEVDSQTESVSSADSLSAEEKSDTSELSMYEVPVPKEQVNNVVDGVVIIEDYTEDSVGLRHLRVAIANSTDKCARIAVIGDSYIEGDILTMNIRESLQSRYGGGGVGYMPAFSELTGFRQTVRQKCSGWTKHEIRKNMRDDMKILPGEYYTAETDASATFSGVSNPKYLDSWNTTTILVNAPSGGSITLNVNGNATTREFEPEDKIQAVSVTGNTSSVRLSASPGIEIAGIFLDNADGIAVDNMSLRGNSGQTHRKLSVERATQMRQFIDYDMIIVEYGINALSSQQSDYSGYKKLMKQTISRLKDCYPNADILVMGIGDRGQKLGTEIKSVPTSESMVKAQRDAARETGVLFWDTRQAMGGEDAVVEWREKGLINPDYIHLNQKGGKVLSELFVKALFKAL